MLSTARFAERRFRAMRRSSRRFLLLLASVALLALCFLCPFSPGSLWLGYGYAVWLDTVPPQLATVALPAPQLLAADLPAGAHTLRWSVDGSQLIVLGTYYEVGNAAPDRFIMTLDAATGAVLSDQRVAHDYDWETEYHVGLKLPQLEDGRTVWGACAEQDVVVTGRALEGAVWEVQLQQADSVLATFQIRSSQYSSSPEYLGAQPRPLNFSPGCAYFAIVWDGWVAWEADGRPELWLLNLSAQTLTLAFEGRRPPSGIWDYPVQSVSGSWSPTGTEFVFGDEQFGLEVFSPSTGARRWLARRAQAGYWPQWSPSGRWIAADRESDPAAPLRLISAETQLTTAAPNCPDLVDWTWSPSDDRLAYLCRDRLGGPQTLWLWTLQP